MKKSRCLAGWLAMLMLLSAAGTITSCSGSESGTVVEDSAATEGTAEADSAEETVPETEPELTDEVPDTVKLGGATVTILYREAMANEFIASDEFAGEIVNDAILEKNHRVEERLEVTLEHIPNPSTDWNGGYQSVISQSIIAGDESYDIISGPSYHIPTLIVKGYLYNLNDVPHLDFEKPWWTQSLMETTAFNNNLYLVSGDISLGMIKYLHCTFFNKELAENYHIEDLYQTVLNDQWTLDKLRSLTDGLYVDVNNNGTSDLDADQFGYVITDANLWRAFIDSLGVNYFYINGEGNPEFNFSDQRAVDVCDAFTQLVGPGSDNDIVMGAGNSTSYDIFTNNRSLFVLGRFVDSELAYRDMESDYGFLPMPKWDETQQGYNTTICGSESTFGIPVNSSRTDVLGAVMEVMAYESYKSVTPAYYESALKVKYTRDDVASQIIDIIRTGARFNPTVQLSKLLGGTDYHIINCAQAGTSIATTFAGMEKSMVKKLENLMETIG